MATKREQYKQTCREVMTTALREAAATLNTDPARDKDYVAIAEEYIAEAEHQDGTGYWAQFASAELVIEDFRLFCAQF